MVEGSLRGDETKGGNVLARKGRYYESKKKGRRREDFPRRGEARHRVSGALFFEKRKRKIIVRDTCKKEVGWRS